MKRFRVTLALLALCAVMRGEELKLTRQSDGVRMENAHLAVIISSRGGVITSLLDKRTQRDHAALAAGPDQPRHFGLIRCRIREDARWNEPQEGETALQVIRQTPEEIAVETVCRAESGPGKGMDFMRTYTLRRGECRVQVQFRINANESWGEFTPWLHQAIPFAASQQDKNSTVVFSQTRRGLFTETPLRPHFGAHAILGDASEPWIGALARSAAAGLCLVTDKAQLESFYSWNGSEYLFTMETLFRKTQFAPGGSWAADLWMIPVSGLDQIHFATPHYVGELRQDGIRLFPAVALKSLQAELTLDAQPATLSGGGDLAAGDVALLPMTAATVGGRQAQLVLHDAGILRRRSEHAFTLPADDSLFAVTPFLNFESGSQAAQETAALSYVKETLYLSPDLGIPVHFAMAANFKKNVPVEMVLELPEGIAIRQPQTTPHSEILRENGKTITRHVFRGTSRTYYNWPSGEMFMTTTLPPGTGSEIVFYVRWQGGAQAPQRLPVESVRIQAGRQTPRRLLTGFGFYGLPLLKRWPEIHADLKKLGLNVVSLHGADWKDVAGMREAVAAARAAGMLGVTANYSPTYIKSIPGLEDNDDAKVRALDGSVYSYLCPTFRGPGLDEEIRRAATYAEAGASIIYWDAESWKGREFCFCPRCMARFERDFRAKHPGKEYISPLQFEQNFQDYPEYHQIWLDFRIALGVELCRLYRDAYARRYVEATGGRQEELQLGFYGLIPGRIYHQFKRFEEFYQGGVVNLCMPSYYVAGNARVVAEGMRNIRQTPGDFRVIPWITGGPYPSLAGDAIGHKYVLLEIFLNGGNGFTTWPYLGWDALDLHYLSQVMNMIMPLEDIVMDGSIMAGLSCSSRHSSVVGISKGEEAALLISDYYHAAIPELAVTLTSPVAAALFDVGSGEKLADLQAGPNTVTLPPYPERARLLYLGQKAPELSYPCPATGTLPASTPPEAAADPVRPGDTLQAREEKGMLIVGNGYYQIGFRQDSGSIAMLHWQETGKRVANRWISGELLQANDQAFTLRGAKASRVELQDGERAGEKRLTVTSASGYSEKESDGEPVLTTYTYTFRAGSPVITLDLAFRQNRARRWNLTRFNQFNFAADGGWTQAIHGAPTQATPLEPTIKDRQFKSTSQREPYRWWGVADQDNAMALVSTGTQPAGFVHAYTHDRMYVVGRYGALNDTDFTMRQHIYVGPMDAALIQRWAQFLLAAEE